MHSTQFPIITTFLQVWAVPRICSTGWRKLQLFLPHLTGTGIHDQPHSTGATNLRHDEEMMIERELQSGGVFERGHGGLADRRGLIGETTDQDLHGPCDFNRQTIITLSIASSHLRHRTVNLQAKVHGSGNWISQSSMHPWRERQAEKERLGKAVGHVGRGKVAENAAT